MGRAARAARRPGAASTPATRHPPFQAGKVAVIDSEGAFRPERVRAVALRCGLDPDAVLDNVLAARAHTFEQMDNLLVRWRGGVRRGAVRRRAAAGSGGQRRGQRRATHSARAPRSPLVPPS